MTFNNIGGLNKIERPRGEIESMEQPFSLGLPPLSAGQSSEFLTTKSGKRKVQPCSPPNPPPAKKMGKILPKTGEETNVVTSLIGLVLLAITGLAAILYRESKAFKE